MEGLGCREGNIGAAENLKLKTSELKHGPEINPFHPGIQVKLLTSVTVQTGSAQFCVVTVAALGVF